MDKAEDSWAASSPSTTATAIIHNQRARPKDLSTLISRCSHFFDWPGFSLLLLIWAPCALGALYAKQAILRWDGYLNAALSLGRYNLGWDGKRYLWDGVFSRPPLFSGQSVVTDPTKLFTVGEKLSFFRTDLLLSLVIVPLVLLLLSGLLRRRLLVGAVSIISIAWIVVINVQLEAFRLIGNYQPLELLKDAVQWGLKDSRQASSYIVGMAVFRICVLVATVLMVALFRPIRKTLFGLSSSRRKTVGLVAGLISLGAVGLSWLPWMPRTVLHRSVQLDMAAALTESGLISGSGPLLRNSQVELKQRYRQISGAPERKAAPAHWGAAPDYDVLIFVLETTPARCVAFDGSIDDLPNMRELRKQAWVGARHYTTFPITTRALFSLLTAQYPPNQWSKDNLYIQDHVSNSLMSTLGAAGYETAVYGSSDALFQGTRQTLENIGFRHIQSASLDMDPQLLDFSGKRDSQSFVIHEQQVDLLALKQLKTDAERWMQGNQRYAAVFLPQISHGPWGDIRSNGRETNLLTRCRSLIQVEDQWLGDILDLLKQHGRLSRTLIVITGDHGVRTPVEDPAFPRGFNDDYSFHVPFLLYAPGVLHSTNILHWVTSHIDVTPSILDLLGLSRDTDHEQGMALWDEGIEQRTTYFLATPLHPADGYYSKGKFYSWNRMLDTTSEKDQLHFGIEDILPGKSPLHDDIVKNVRALDQLRSVWVRASSPD